MRLRFAATDIFKIQEEDNLKLVTVQVVLKIYC